MIRIDFVAFLLVGAMGSGSAFAQDLNCGHPYDSPGRYGPFDYTDPTKGQELHLVEIAHFTPFMEETALYGFSSRRATSSVELEGRSQIAGNFDYTLHAFPNHHRALYAMGVWQLRIAEQSPTQLKQLLGGDFKTADCYFERAIMFKPDDGMARHAYGAYLHRAGKLREAEAQYLKAIELIPNSAEPHYNLGLLYVDLGDRTKAEEHAARAYELGYPLQGLRRKLDQLRRRSN